MGARRPWPGIVVWFAGGVCVLVGLALAADLVRLHWARSEVRRTVATAALAAASELDGTAEGLLRARQAAQQAWRRSPIASAVANIAEAEFAHEPEGPWKRAPAAPLAQCWFVRVRAEGAVPPSVLSILQPAASRTVHAAAIAAPRHDDSQAANSAESSGGDLVRLVAIFTGDTRSLGAR